MLPPDMAAYREMSAQVWALVRERFLIGLQQAGIDEAYVDVSALEQPLAQLRAAVAEVRERTGLTLSVGVGPSRLVAKVSSGAVKPNGFGVLSREQACAHFAGESVRILQGIGPRTAERLAELAITTVGDLQAMPVEQLGAQVGREAARRLHALAHFHDRSPVEPVREVKSCSRETTFPADLTDPAQVRQALAQLADRLADDLARRDLAGRTIGIKVRRGDWSTLTRARTLAAPTLDPATLRQIALELLEAEAINGAVRLVGVRSAGFGEASAAATPRAQLTLPLET